MSSHLADRNLLLGIVALQMDFINGDQLIAAMQQWITNKQVSLAEILCSSGDLSTNQKHAIEIIVEESIRKHGGNASQSLAHARAQVHGSNVLDGIQDKEIATSLFGTLSKPNEADPYETEVYRSPSVDASIRFQRLRPYAKGGMGAVWIAIDHELNREVAVKEIQEKYADQTDARIQFLLEGEITGGLEHPGIVPVYGMGAYPDGRPYYAMRFIRGDSLKDAIDRYHAQRPKSLLGADRNAIELRKLLARFIDVCHAISYAHSRGVLHRDLKPGNIMLGKFGETLVVDWGLAQTGTKTQGNQGESLEQPLRPQSGSSSPMQFSTPGTVQFMSPEQARGDLSLLNATSDIYSLGATLYTLLTGRPSIAERDLFLALKKVQEGDFPKPSHWKADIPKPLEAICLKAMAHEQPERYESALALAEDIECWLADEPVLAWKDTRRQRLQRWLRKHRAWAQAGASSLIALTALTLIASYFIYRAKEAEHTLRRISESAARFDIALRDEAILAQRNGEAFSLSSLQQIRETYDSLRLLDAPGTDAKFDALVEQIDRYLLSLAARERFDEPSLEKFDRCLTHFKNAFGVDSKTHFERWSTIRTSRMSQWNEVLDLHRFESSDMNHFGPSASQITIDGDGRLIRTPTSGSPEVQMLNIPRCHFDWQIEFDASWTTRPIIGTFVEYGHPQEQVPGSVSKERYELLLTVPEFNHRDRSDRELSKLPTIHQVLNESTNRELRMHVLRNGQLLRTKTVRFESGPIRLTASREDQVIKFSAVPIGGRERGVTIDCHDPFAIPNQEGTLGVHLAQGVRIVAMTLRQRSTPLTPSRTEKGDLHFLAGRFDEAKTAYSQVVDSPEAQYKLALCFEQTGDFESYWNALQELAKTPVNDSFNQWTMLANLRLLANHAKKRDWEVVRESTILFQEQSGNATLFSMLPQEDRDLVLQELGKAGLRFRLAFQRDEDRELLKIRKDLVGLLLEDDATRINTLWREADILRMNGEFEEAASILQDLADDRWRTTDGEVHSSTIPMSSKDRRILLSDFSWLLSAERHLPQDALILVDQWSGQQEKILENALPLTIERARIQLLLRERAIEEKDTIQAERYLKAAQAELSSLNNLLKVCRDTTYMEWSQGQLLRLLIAKEEGKEDEAREALIAAQRRSWSGGPLKLLHPSQLVGADGVVSTHELALEGIAISFSKEVTSDEIDRMVRNYFPGSGISSSVSKSLLNLVLSPESRFGNFSRDEFLKRLICDLYDSERGQEFRKRMILKDCSLLEYQAEPVYHIFFTAIQLAGFGETGYPEWFIPIVWEELIDLVQRYNDRVLVENDLSEILKLFSGKYTPKIWNHVSQKFGPRLRSAAAYIFGSIYLQKNDTAVSRRFFQEVISNPDSRPEIRDAAKAILNRMDNP